MAKHDVIFDTYEFHVTIRYQKRGMNLNGRTAAAAAAAALAFLIFSLYSG